MLANPKLVKRPVIDVGGRTTVGFNDEVRAAIEGLGGVIPAEPIPRFVMPGLVPDRSPGLVPGIHGRNGRVDGGNPPDSFRGPAMTLRGRRAGAGKHG